MSYGTPINLDGLLDYQRNPLAQLAGINAKRRVTLDASDMGVGKTYIGAGLIRQFDEPTLVVCPRSVIPSWKRAGEHLGVEFDVLNYEMLGTGRTPYLNKRVRTFTYQGKPRKASAFDWAPEVGMVLFDEVHRCGGQSTDNSKMLIRAVAQKKRIHMMSGTPAESPIKMKAMGFALGMFRSPDEWWRWCMRNGCKKGYFGGLQFGPRAEQRMLHMNRINADLFPGMGIRLRKTDIPGFPDCQITTEFLGLPDDDSVAMENLYREMQTELEAHDKHKDPENAAIALMRERQLVELLKVPALVEQTEDAVSSGLSVALFVNFRQTVEALSARLGTKCIIWGDQSSAEREANRVAFQEDRERIILAISDAGGIGIDLHDLNGNYPRLELLNPGWSAVIFRQALNRVWRAGAKTKAQVRILFADTPSERRVRTKLGAKLDNMDALCDADLCPMNLK